MSERTGRSAGDARADRERGVHGFRTEDVAARAGVGKGAIYRRHPSKDDLVMASVAALVDEEIVVPDTGSTRADLLALMREAVELYRGSLPGRLMPNLVSAMAAEAGAGAGCPRGVPDPTAIGVDRGGTPRRRSRRPASRCRSRARPRRARRTALLPAADHRRPDRRTARRRRYGADPARLRTGQRRRAKSKRTARGSDVEDPRNPDRHRRDHHRLA